MKRVPRLLVRGSGASHRLLAAVSLGAFSTAGVAGAYAGRHPQAPRRAGAVECVAETRAGEVASLGIPVVPRELRAAWVSPVEGGEWPSRPGMPPDEQRAELARVLDRAVALGLNAVVLHVRTAADAMYPTDRAPWSSYLVRARGDDASPGYDPLAYAVGEAHRRGLQLHAWFNPFRAAPPEGSLRPGAAFVARTHPEWIVRYGSQTWIDPGIPAARQAVLDAILEVVERYDIDAVHIDDYFYPYQEQRTIRRRVGTGRRRRTVVTRETIAFPDDASWARYGRGGEYETRAAWRRANVNDLVERLYAGVKARKPWVLVGISPFGIWRPGSPPGISGLDSFAETFADSRRWLREGWLDYIAPQLYWQLDGAEHRFARLDAWWRAENVRGRHIWPGLFTMRVASRGSPWPVAEIPAQIVALREARESTSEGQGHVHFRLGAMSVASPLGARLARDVYGQPALPPASPWLGSDVPEAPAPDGCAPAPGPVPIRITKDGGVIANPAAPVLARRAAGTATRAGAMSGTPRAGAAGPWLRLAPGGDASVRWWLVQLRDGGGHWTAQSVAGDARLVSLAMPNGEPAGLAVVTAVSPTGVLGLPSVVRVEEAPR